MEYQYKQRYGSKKGSFSKKLLLNLQYARRWGESVSNPTFKPGHFSPVQTTRPK